MKSERKRKQCRRAFTMMELILALGIIILLTVIAVPAVGPMLGGRSVDGAADAIKAALMHARYSAIAQGREGICWANEGTTCDIGRVTASAASAGMGAEWNRDDSDGSPGFTAIGSWAPDGDGQTLDAAAGNGSATWRFNELHDLEGAGMAQVWVRMRKWPQGHPTVRYKVFGTRSEVNSGTPQATINASHNAPTESCDWVPLGAFNIEGGNVPYVTLENVGPGQMPGPPIVWNQREIDNSTTGRFVCVNPSETGTNSATQWRSGSILGIQYLFTTFTPNPVLDGTGMAYWITEEIPANYTGTLRLEANLRGEWNWCTAICYEIRSADNTQTTSPAASPTISLPQCGGAWGWRNLGEFTFPARAAATRWHIHVKKNHVCAAPVCPNNRTIIADAVRLTGTLTSTITPATTVWADAVKLEGNVPLPPDRFVDEAKTASWSQGQWNGYWAAWVSSNGVLYSKRIKLVDGMPDTKTLVAESNWDPVPPPGAIYLVAPREPSSEPSLPFSVGSGTPRERGSLSDQDEMRWDNLPEYAAVFPYRINGTAGHGTESNTPVFPIVFTSTGRATFSAEHVTMRIYDRQAPDDRARWRYVRVYRNTGRVVVGRTLDELN